MGLPTPRASRAPVITAVTDHVHLVQGHAVNWVVVTDHRGVTLIDAGYPGDRGDVLGSLRQLGFGIEDVRAILLTHAHVDHMGSAIWFAKTHGTPVYCHVDEVSHAKRECLEQKSTLDVAVNLWRHGWAKLTLHLLRHGGLTREGIPTAQALTTEVAAELPGAPLTVPTPGHTSGHCSYLVDGVLATGDALVTGHPVCRRTGPQLLPDVFNHNQAESRRSVSELSLLEADALAPGHGPLWRGPIRDAVEQALRGVPWGPEAGMGMRRTITTAIHHHRHKERAARLHHQVGR
jgi:glyoxylase-like metal-dependent hydrolase (beta-lactamase superfamily II)